MYQRFYSFLITSIVLLGAWNNGEALETQTVTFETGDGGSVNALLYGKGEQAVVLAHGAVFSKESWDRFAAELVKEGFAALALDFRGYGRSKAGSNPDGLFEDVLAAVRYLHRQGATRVSVIGGSMGAAAAAKASVSSRPGEIDKLVLLSPIAISHPEGLKGKLLIVGSQGESMAENIQTIFDTAPQPKRLVFLEGTAHAQHIFNTEQAGKLKAVILELLHDSKVDSLVRK